MGGVCAGADVMALGIATVTTLPAVIFCVCVLMLCPMPQHALDLEFLTQAPNCPSEDRIKGLRIEPNTLEIIVPMQYKQNPVLNAFLHFSSSTTSLKIC